MKDDLISRQAAIDAVRKLYIKEPKINNDYAYDMAIDEADDAIRELPSAQFDPVKHGKWLLHEYPDGYYHTECSECGKIYSENVYFIKKPNYCPNCGARMQERSEE